MNTPGSGGHRSEDIIVKTLVVLLAAAIVHIDAAPAGVVAVNQVGYLPGGEKTAILTSPADSFFVVNTETAGVVYRGRVRSVTSLDPASGLSIFNADFTPLATPGWYCVRSSSGDSSFHFRIAEDVYAPLLCDALRSYFFQRCGCGLPESIAGQWWHGACHVNTDAAFHAATGFSGAVPAWGGWHDAGDYGKYVVNAGVTVGTMLMAYEEFPAVFRSDDLRIPESGNGVPDILDEIRYELNWFFTMQAPDGGVFHKITKPQFEGFVMPEDDTGQRYMYPVSSAATADFAAVMARASRIFRAFDVYFAGKCMEAAEKAWHYLQVRPVIVPPGGFKNPPGTATGEYEDNDDSDERLWAAVELFLANGSASARSHFEKNYMERGIVAEEISWRNVRTLAQCAYLRGSREGIDAAIRGKLRGSLLERCQAIIAVRDSNGFRTALPYTEYSWGSNSRILNNAVLLVIGSMEGGAEEFEKAAIQQLHYVLGVNALLMSFVTGTGTHSPMNPHHRPSGADGVDAPVPGLLVGGPNARINQDSELKSRFTATTPPALCYADAVSSYASNETAINWNAPLVFLIGYVEHVASDAGALPGGR